LFENKHDESFLLEFAMTQKYTGCCWAFYQTLEQLPSMKAVCLLTLVASVATPILAFAPSKNTRVSVLQVPSPGPVSQRQKLYSSSSPVDELDVENSASSPAEATQDGVVLSSLVQLNDTKPSKRTRFLESLPKIWTQKDELDLMILKTAIPNMINLGVVPIVNAVDTFWVGRLGLALALAGQSAANQACFTLFFLIAFLPNITAPLVASAVASNNTEEAQKRVCESLFLCNILGFIGTVLLVAFPRRILSALVLPADAPAMAFAAPYLRWRAIGMVPSLISATGFAAYRGMLNTVTPLKVSLMTNAVNLILDPLFMFHGGFGFVGAAMATAASETIGGLTYLKLLLRRKLARWSLLLRPPSWKSMAPLLQGGAAMLIRQLALNAGFLVATKRAHTMDPTGVAGAAYGITMQIYSVGIIMLVAMQSTTAALVPSSLAKNGPASAQKCADRLFAWSSLVGLLLGVAQYLLLPVLVPIFSTLPEVREAVRVPALIASLIHVVNGPILAGEGVMLGMGSYRDLAIITGTWIAAMIGCLASPLGKRLDGIMWSILLSSVIGQIGVVGHYLKFSPLAKHKGQETATSPTSS
jgi:putative MATE family efflux protein